MLNVGMLYVHFKEEPLCIKAKTKKVLDPNIVKEDLKSPQNRQKIEIGSQIQW